MACLLHFFFNDTATAEIYTLSLHDALPIFGGGQVVELQLARRPGGGQVGVAADHRDHLAVALLGVRLVAHPHREDRKSTRLNSSHANIPYAVFCLKKKKKRSTPVTSVSANL